MQDKPTALDALTSFRFIAALLVFVWHTHIFSSYLDQFQFGYVGVGFFYMLSGFILTYVYFNKLRSKKNGAVKNFYIARFAKIYPTYVLTFLLSIPLALMTFNMFFPDNTTMTFIGLSFVNLSLLQSFFPDTLINFSFNTVAWSISTEAFFYALFPIAIATIVRYYRSLTIKKLALIAIALWIVMMLAIWPQESRIDHWNYYIFPLVRLPDFIIGLLLGLIYLQIKAMPTIFAKLTYRHFTFFEISALILLLLGITVSTGLPQSVRFGLWLMPFWAVVILVFAHQRGAISRALSIKPLVFLGEISFSFYMLHGLIIRYVDIAGIPVYADLLSFILAISISALTFIYFEEPMRVRVKQFLQRKHVNTRLILESWTKRLLTQGPPPKISSMVVEQERSL